MTYNVSSEVESLIRQHMATGQYESEDALLRDALEQLVDETLESDDDWAAIQEGLEELDRGVPGIPLEEVRRRLLPNLLRHVLKELSQDRADDDLQAIRTAIDEWQQGDHGMELDAAFEEVRHSVEKRLKS